ncbi:unnamed protein product, partial [Heterotrigona itama]
AVGRDPPAARCLVAWLKGWGGRVMTGLPGGRRVKDEGAGSLCCGRSMQQRCPQPQQQQQQPPVPSNIAFA